MNNEKNQPFLFDDYRADEKTKMEEFGEYHRRNPQIYQQFKRFAFDAINAGRTHFSARMVIERIRWETSVQASGDGFKVNNNWVGFYARLFEHEFPQHRGLFEKRSLKNEEEFAGDEYHKPLRGY